MSQLDELLNSMSVEELIANPETEEHIIIGLDRKITVPDSLKRIAVQGDHNVETVTFDSPRYWDGRDLSELNIFINFICANGRVGTYLVPSVSVDEVDQNIIHYDWIIKEEVTAAKGNLVFLVCAKSTDEEGMPLIHWNSERCSDMYVSEGLEVTNTMFTQNPDILNRVLLLTDITLTRAGVYVGSGDMPDWANVQVDPTGTPTIGGNGEVSEEQIAELISAYLQQHPFTVSPMTSTSLGGAKLGSNLKMSETDHLYVDTANAVEANNTKPVTSEAVFAMVGNVESLLSKI